MKNQYPLTNSQLAIWTGQKVSEDAPLYNMINTFEIKGDINPGLFTRAFQLLINETESLRIVFGEYANGTPYQRFLDSYDYEIACLDFRNKNTSFIDEYIFERGLRLFDLAQPPFDCVLLHTDRHAFTFYLNIHHLVTDVSTSKILFERLGVIYSGLHAGNTVEKVSNEYAKYLKYERDSKDSIKEKLDISNVEKLSLYDNQSGPHSTESTRIKLALTPKNKQLIQQLCDNSSFISFNKDITLFLIYSTLFVSFIHRVTGGTNITVGTPLINRPPNFKDTAGLFIELLPFSVALDSEDTFSSIFTKLRNAYYELLKRSKSGIIENSIVKDVNFVINYIPLKIGDFGSFKSENYWLDNGHIDPQHGIRLQIFNLNENNDSDLYFDLNNTHLSKAQLQSAPEHFSKLMDGLLKYPEKQVDSFAMVEATAIQSNIEDSKTTFLELWDRYFPDDTSLTAVECDDKKLSYGFLESKSNQLANHLIRKGMMSGDRVVIHMKRSEDLLVAVLGVIKAGGCFVLISEDVPKKRQKLIISDVEPFCVIAEKNKIQEGNDYVAIADIDESEDASRPDTIPAGRDLMYILYTSGSTGKPKGVMISHRSLGHYLTEARSLYYKDEPLIFPLFTSISFDLTVTSLLLPIVTQGCVQIYPETKSGPDLSILEVVKSSTINSIKLTPSHAQLIRERDLQNTSIKCVILGGEDLETTLASDLHKNLPKGARIFNEYGPTEATVGCIVHEYNPEKDLKGSVPIGEPMHNCEAYVLDNQLNLVPEGVPGMLYLGGIGLSNGYWNNAKLTSEAFISNPFNEGKTIYKTGDLVRTNAEGKLTYKGRIDDQIKLNGVRIESKELENLMVQYSGIEEATICVVDSNTDRYKHPNSYCKTCGIPSNYPDITFNEKGICNLCMSFDNYQQNVSSYFKEYNLLKSEILSKNTDNQSQYDCMMLLSGGKDSSYALAQLVESGLRVLAFTLDNGFISDSAKNNIANTTEKLGVDHIYGTTDSMNAIFRDSLQRHQNVCNGCFKTLYTLSIKLALDKGIPVIVTGLSRGQFFETRLTEELFVKKDFDPSDIDKLILDARKSYHRSQDAVSDHLDVSIFKDDEVFEKVSFLDFYRFSDVKLSEMLKYLEDTIGWIRPDDTGRSTNCIINDLGIYVHKRKKGYHNYAFPYSWDVRVGHKKREETIDELNDELNPDEIDELMKQIGIESSEHQVEIRAYFRSGSTIDTEQLVQYLQEYLPHNMIPSTFLRVDSFPLTENGKIDKIALINETINSVSTPEGPIVEPENKIEQVIHDIFCKILNINKLSVTDSFITIGGNSLSAIRIISLISQKLTIDVDIQVFFEKNSIRKLSQYIEDEIRRLMKAQ